MFRLILTCLVCLTIAGPGLAQTRADPEAATGWAPKPLGTAARHMIVAAHPLAAEAGREILRAGGSAADAAVASLLVLNVVEPQSSGIGGGAFALVHGPDGLASYDARETAPMAATERLFFEGTRKLGWREAVPTGRSVGVPGLVRLMEVLHARHGRLAWAELFQPALRLARDGFAVSPRLAASVAAFEPVLAGTDAAAFLLPGGVALAEGDILRQPALAETLETLATEGAEAFYTGEIAAEILAATAQPPLPGALVGDDLVAYRVIARAPVCAGFRDLEICGMGPPSSGATTVGQILGLMPDDLPPGAPGLHLFAEASRLAYADRAAYLADPDQVRVPVKGLLDPGYLAERAALIDPTKAAEGPASAGDPPWREGRYAPAPPQSSPGTTHLSVVDGEGLAISLTASIETAFGSKRMAAGFLLNNQLTDFSFTPEGADGTPIANAPGPGKRPRSSMAPTIVLRDGKPLILAGSPGGSRIPEYVARALLLMLVEGADPAVAAAAPHLSQRNRDTLVLEPGHAPGTAAALRTFGHQIETAPMTSGLHLIVLTPEGLQGGADPRREGVALGD